MKKQFHLLVLILVFFISLIFGFVIFRVKNNLQFYNNIVSQIPRLTYQIKNLTPDPSPFIFPTLPLTPFSNPTQAPKQIIITQVPQPNPDDDQWGIAKKIDDHTYTIKVGYDERMATADEIVKSLNDYRQTNSQWALKKNDKLTAYAQTRADYFKSIESTDRHEGFNDFLENQDGFSQLGFSHLGENSYYGGPLLGVHLIEWVFAKSPEHNANQLYGEWTDVGVGVTETSVNIIFGKDAL